jgi:hypothetical protein
MYAAHESAMAVLNRAQKIGACAITGAFHTVALAVVEAEAYIRPIRQRQFERATKLYIGIRTFPDTHPLRKLQIRAFRRFISPLQRIALSHRPTSKIEIIQPFSVAPWDKRIGVLVQPHQEAARMASDAQGIVVATSASEKKGIVGIGGVICDTTTTEPPDNAAMATYTVTLGPRDRFNIYFAEIIAVATAYETYWLYP